MFKGLKYKLNRSTLIILYKSLIRPIMEYADVVWDGCKEVDSELLEGLQYESAQVVTGAIKGTSKSKLFAELSWESLKTRRFMHKLTLFYKIVNYLTPPYLTMLLPQKVAAKSCYSLRSSDNFSSIPARTNRFKKSFLPSVISDWNNLDISMRTSCSIDEFKLKLCDKLCVKYNRLYNASLSRKASILHTRLRLGHCALNQYLYKISCNDSPLCDCNDGSVESTSHYLLHCARYAVPRQTLLTLSAQLFKRVSSNDKVKFFLNGSPRLTPKQNEELFIIVQKFIMDTKRFQ